MTRWVANRLYQWLGCHRHNPRSYGMPSPPCDGIALRYGETDQGLDPPAPMYVAMATNDGHELFIGYPSEWQTHMRRSDAHRLAWWILVRWWAYGEWFGLRRVLWYWALSAKYRPMKPSPSGSEEPR